ncbi:hypothetical protein CcCBS67573_g06684 [Chytriomyces confervae]|uniref:Uncharacterized protein n=1 Tax=Chytriomyces confervae TaxID=246404 RepID=A0A507F0V4_9FUNG|nr:hypothetical protein CcCBS67573_g06684 [Chytriomyces confervae]
MSEMGTRGSNIHRLMGSAKDLIRLRAGRRWCF